MDYWLVKSEPGAYSWDDMVRDGSTHWNGVRNHQAANNLKAMKTGDKAFFYHSVNEKQVVGIVEVAKEYYPDHTDKSGRFGMVDFKAVAALTSPVSLTAIKSEPKLANIGLVRQSRLSVMPIGHDEWKLICRMGDTKP